MDKIDLSRLEVTLSTDRELRRKYEELIRRYAAEGERDVFQAAAKAAAELGVTVEAGASQAVDDDVLASVSGGVSLHGAGGTPPSVDSEPFNLNRWIGELLREGMKKDSAKHTIL